MATKTTYLLIAGGADVDESWDLSVLSEYDFEHHKTYEGSSDQLPAEKYAIEEPLEEADDLLEQVRMLSDDHPELPVLVCEIEERFDQIDAVRTILFLGGRQAGDIEHGHVFNVGGR